LLFASAYAGHLRAHGMLGNAVLVLVLYRLAWGFVGSQTARFSDFVKGPAGIATHLAGRARPTLGHNPLGGLMVVGLLVALLSQAVLGLCSSDGLTFDGPLAHRIGPVAADVATRAHVVVAKVIAGLVATHVAAVLLHLWRNENLVVPMFTGRKDLPQGTVPPRFVSAFVALGLVALMAALVALANCAA
jgi:cytochrome b